MTMHERMIFAGFGGQGLLTAGKLLAQCAMDEGRQVTYFPSYGAEVRGGTANCQIVVSDEVIASPLVEEATSLLIMNEASLKKFLPMLAADGFIVYNRSMIEDAGKIEASRALGIDATNLADKLGSVLAANMILLSALNTVRALVSPERLHDRLIEALSGRRERFIPVNEKALDAGRELAEAWMKKRA
jgi:2-oxoglutarate ferredoxin oxidoreductase subunit gamma